MTLYQVLQFPQVFPRRWSVRPGGDADSREAGFALSASFGAARILACRSFASTKARCALVVMRNPLVSMPVTALWVKVNTAITRNEIMDATLQFRPAFVAIPSIPRDRTNDFDEKLKILRIFHCFQYSELQSFSHPSGGVFTIKNFVGKTTQNLGKQVLL